MISSALILKRSPRYVPQNVHLLCEHPTAAGACGSCAACQLVAAGTHPDLVVIEPRPPENSSSKQPVLSIRIEVIRELCARLNTTSQFGGYRVAVLQDADRMRHEAANSLLKTLEEPGQDTLLLLVTSQPQRLPVTIRSRCQQIAFPMPTADEALSWCEQQSISDAAQRLRISHGSPLIAAADSVRGDAHAVMAKALLARQGRESSLAHAAELAALPRQLGLGILLDWLGDLIRLKAGTDAPLSAQAQHHRGLGELAQQVDWKRSWALYDEICRLRRYDAIALDNQLLWENLLISWDRL